MAFSGESDYRNGKIANSSCVALSDSLSLVWFASSPNAAVLDSSIKASSFGLKIANALRFAKLDCLTKQSFSPSLTLPVIELRGAIPVVYWLQLKPVTLPDPRHRLAEPGPILLNPSGSRHLSIIMSSGRARLIKLKCKHHHLEGGGKLCVICQEEMDCGTLIKLK
ncbi:hypothetical protein LINPERPRIM_LOCUS21947 [Linum perenne]